MRKTLCLYLVALAALPQVLRRMPPTPAGKGSIEGIVSDTISHAPIPKAQVSLTLPMGGPVTAVTDGSGRFAFRNLPAGNYWLNATKPGYQPPQVFMGIEGNSPILLGADEQKKDVEVPLLPSGSIRGRIVNQEGSPVRHCAVTAVQPAYERNRRTLRGVAGATGNDRGEYRLETLPPGRYFVFAHCQAELPAPHPLLPRGDPRTPHETYLPRFYGGGVDPSTATKLTVAAGASLDNVDFEMVRTPAFTLRVTVSGSDAESNAGIILQLLPANRLMRNLMPYAVFVDAQNKFEIRAVIPGSYLLFATTQNPSRFTARTVEVGAAPPDPLELTLSAGSELKGSLQFDCDDRPPFENGEVMLGPLEGPAFLSQPRARIDKDGAFALTGVMPGRWRLIVSAPGFPKSASLAGQPVSPYNFQLAAGATGPLRIVMGCKTADLSVSVSGAPAGRPVAALIYPEDPERLGAGLERIGVATGSAQIDFGAHPIGRYRVLATDIQNPWPILERPDLLKALEARIGGVDLTEGARATVTVDLIPREEVLRLLEGL